MVRVRCKVGTPKSKMSETNNLSYVEAVQVHSSAVTDNVIETRDQINSACVKYR